MNLSTGTMISQLPTGTSINGNDIFPFVHGITGSATPQTQQASCDLLRVTLTPGYLQENSAQLTYVTGSSYQVEAGSADINGTLITWGVALVRSSLTLTSGTMTYVYMGASGTSPFLEESVTVPVWDSTVNYYKKTGDATRRMMGFLQIETVNKARKFINNVRGRYSEVWYVDGTVAADAKIVVSSLASTGSWSSFSMATTIPSNAQEALLIVKAVMPTSADDVTIGLSPISLGTVDANTAPYQVRGRAGANGANIFFGNTWLIIKETQTGYYRTQNIAGTDMTTQISVQGARFTR